MEKIYNCHKKHQNTLLRKSNVVSVGYGYKYINGEKTNKVCLIIGVSKKVKSETLKKHDIIPSNIDGVDTDIFEIGNVVPFIKSKKGKSKVVDPTKKFRPAMPGVSIAEKNVTAGTFGMVVQKNGQRMILSNNHVLAACFDDQTEVLTKNGFKHWENVTSDDEFATLNVNTNHLEYQKSTKLHNYYYNGDLIHFEDKNIDCVVTPNHRMWAKKTYKSGTPSHVKPNSFNFIKAEDIVADMNVHNSVSYCFSDKAEWHYRSPETVVLPTVKYIKGKNYNYRQSINCVSKPKQMSDDVQKLFFKTNHSLYQRTIYGSPYNPGSIYNRVDTRKRSYLRLQKTPQFMPSYSGHVYCATVPNSTLYIRRNGHCMWTGNSNNALIGDAIFQPGSYDGGTSNDTIAILDDFIPIDFGSSGGDPRPPSKCLIGNGIAKIVNFGFSLLGRKTKLVAVSTKLLNNRVDAALGQPLNDADIIDNIVHIGKPAGLSEAILGMPIQKYGRTTKYTTGEVLQMNATVNVSYGPNRTGTFVGQIIAGDMSDGGDSGSAILDMKKNVIGLLFAGSDTSTIINPIQDVFNQLGITF